MSTLKWSLARLTHRVSNWLIINFFNTMWGDPYFDSKMDKQVARALEHFSTVKKGAQELVLHLASLIWLQNLHSSEIMVRSSLTLFLRLLLLLSLMSPVKIGVCPAGAIFLSIMASPLKSLSIPGCLALKKLNNIASFQARYRPTQNYGF